MALVKRSPAQVGAHDRVSDLGGRTRRAAVDAPADDDPAADAGTDREHHKVAGDEHAVLVIGLGERRARRVVVDEDGDAQPLAQHGAQRHVVQWDVHRRADPAGLPVDDRWNGDADGGGIAGRRDGVDELGDQRFGAARVGRLEHGLAQRRAVEHRDSDLRAANVDADQPLCHQTSQATRCLRPSRSG